MSTAREWWGYWDCIFLGLCKSQGIWSGGFRHVHMGIKDFHKCWSGSLAKMRLCLGPASVINCPPLSALSFWVSLFPGTRGCNNLSVQFKITLQQIGNMSIDPTEWNSKGNFEIGNSKIIIIIIMLRESCDMWPWMNLITSLIFFF